MTKTHKRSEPSVNQAKTIPFPSPEKLQKNTLWLKQLQRLHKDEPEKIDLICIFVEGLKVGRGADQYHKLINDLKGFESTDFDLLNKATKEIEEVYESVYTDAEIIPFKGGAL